MEETPVVADLQNKTAALSQENNSYRKDEEKTTLQTLADAKVTEEINIIISKEVANQLKKVQNALDILRDEFATLKLLSETKLESIMSSLTRIEEHNGNSQPVAARDPFTNFGLPQNLTAYLKENCVEMVLSKADQSTKFTKTAETLLELIVDPSMTTKTTRLAVALLSEIASNSDEHRRNFLGQIGCVEKICDVIEQQADTQTYGEILEISWNCLFNLCRVPLENNDRFLSEGGMNLFHLCYAKFGEEEVMLEAMMAMMWNLSCFPSIRQELACKEHLSAFWNVLQNSDDCVTVSYRCVKLFTNFVSDSAVLWPLGYPTVSQATNHLIATICTWDLGVQMSFELHTFEGYLSDLKLHLSSLEDLIIVWLIANFTTFDGNKYCRMLIDEGGVSILNAQILRRPNSSIDMVRLAIKALDNVNGWVNRSRWFLTFPSQQF